MGCRSMKPRHTSSRLPPIAATRSARDGVLTVPGQIALQRTPCPTKSAAIDFVNPITAAFVTEYAKRLGTPLMLDATEDMLMMLPRLRANIPASADRHVQYMASTLIWNDRRQSASVHARMLPWCT